MKVSSTAALCAAMCILFSSCSDTTVKPANKATEAAIPPPEPITGRHAFQQIYPMARSWAVDAQPVRVQSIALPNVKTTDGKAGAWEVLFFSPATGRTKTYTWSESEAGGNLHQGVFAGQEESMGSAKPFPISAIQQDSDEAYKVAVSKSADYIKKNPDKPVIYILEMSNRFPQLVWRVVWGESVGTSDYSVFVDAATGKFLQTMH